MKKQFRAVYNVINVYLHRSQTHVNQRLLVGNQRPKRLCQSAFIRKKQISKGQPSGE